MEYSLWSVFGSLLVALLAQKIGWVVYNYFLHPLAKFPGPPTVATGWYKAWHDLVLGRNASDVLKEAHAKYGEVVRIGPNELHFSNPQAFHEIYNASNRWDKEATLYQSFGEDRSSFGFLTYREAKQRKDVLAPLFSKRAASDLQDLVKKYMNRLCNALTAEYENGKSSDMLFALRCYTIDVIMQYCFAKDVHATQAAEFKDPFVVAMDASLPSFVVFRHFELIRKMVFSFPGWLTKAANPALTGLVDLQAMMSKQVQEIVNNPQSLRKTSHETVYHRLLDPEADKATGIPEPGSLFEEALALFFGAVDSSANTTMMGIYHIMRNSDIRAKLEAELLSAWPDLEQMPKVEDLEKLQFLTAIIKESLRMSPSVAAPLPRIVPATGATICGKHIPAGTIVGMAITFVHYSEEIFPEPNVFNPERWLGEDVVGLEKWLVAFSRGPRSCLGQNLAMSELYIAFAALFRRFDLELDGTTGDKITWRECFLPHFNERHLRAYCKPVAV